MKCLSGQLVEHSSVFNKIIWLKLTFVITIWYYFNDISNSAATNSKQRGDVLKPIYTKVTDYVMKKIQSGEWPVGFKLPTEMEFCELFDISRQSVRTALLSLVNDGYLVRTKRRGTFVTTPQRVEESTVFIESFAEEMHKRGYEVETEVLEFRVMQASDKILKFLQLKPGAKVIKLTRLRYCKDSFDVGPIVLTTSYYTMKLDYLQNYDFSKTSVHEAMQEHDMAKKYTEKYINVAVLDSRSSRLMCVDDNSIALSITSYTRDQDEELIEYCESFYPASRNEFILKIRL